MCSALIRETFALNETRLKVINLWAEHIEKHLPSNLHNNANVLNPLDTEKKKNQEHLNLKG